MNHIKYVFFDLDHTIWDFERCSQETLSELFVEYRQHIGVDIDIDHFISCYRRNNEILWRKYERNEVKSEDLRRLRWENTFGDLSVEMGPWSAKMGTDYLYRCPRKPYLIEGAKDALDYLSDSYDVHMITNGWTENQSVKLQYAGVADYFGEVITADGADAIKPDRRIFDYAIDKTGAKREQCLYVGDNYECDVEGGKKAGWDVVFYNPHGRQNPIQAPEIKSMSELIGLL